MSEITTALRPQGPAFATNNGWLRISIGLVAVGYALVAVTRIFIQRQFTSFLLIDMVTALACFTAYLTFARWPRPSGLFVLGFVWLQLTHHIYSRAAPEVTAMLVYPALMLPLGLLFGERWSIGGAILTCVAIPVAVFGGRYAQSINTDTAGVVVAVIIVEIVLICSGVFARTVLASFRRLLADSEKLRWRYTRLFQDMPDGLLEIDTQGRILEVNVAVEQLFDTSREQLIGRLLGEVLQHCGMGPDLVLADLRPGQPVMLQAGRMHYEITVGTPPDTHDSTLLVLRDVTIRHRTQERQAMVQRLETVGQLAGGIAHEYNNLLTAIGGNAGLLKTHEDQDVQRFAGQIMIAQQRAATLTRQMLAFARHDFHQAEIISLGLELQEWGELLRHLMGDHGQLEIKGTGAAWVEADRVQIEQILVNLINNARDATPPGGIVELRYSRLTRTAASRLGSQLNTGWQVMLEIEDRGHGMTPDVKSRLFEPFFTTKSPGQGTGLGLAAVHGLIMQNHGAIDIVSEVGQGTTVRVFFAEVDENLWPVAGARPSAAVASRRHVLLVDDDATTNKTAVFALEQAGYQVTVVGHGPDAVKCFHQASAEIQLAIISANFPELSGRELGEIIRKLQPGLTVLYVCGRFVVPPDWPNDEWNFPLLLKPFRSEELLKRVAALLPEKEK